MRVMDLNFCVNVVVILFVDVSKLNLNYEYCMLILNIIFLFYIRYLNGCFVLKIIIYN